MSTLKAIPEENSEEYLEGNFKELLENGVVNFGTYDPEPHRHNSSWIQALKGVQRWQGNEPGQKYNRNNEGKIARYNYYFPHMVNVTHEEGIDENNSENIKRKQEKKKLPKRYQVDIYENFFQLNTPYSHIGRAIFNAHKEGNKSKISALKTQLRNDLLEPSSSKNIVGDLFKYVEDNYDELKGHYNYYNAKAARGGRRRSRKHKSTRRKRMTRRK